MASIFRKEPRPNSRLFPDRPFASDPGLAEIPPTDPTRVQSGDLPSEPSDPPKNVVPFKNLKGR